MASARSTQYAPDIYKALNGILLVHKPPQITYKVFVQEIRHRVSAGLNQFEPRPLDKMLKIVGDFSQNKCLLEVPNLADHPLVVGPRYAPWELSLYGVKPFLGYRSTGVSAYLLGSAMNSKYKLRFSRAKFINVYHISGCFGYLMDNFFYDGKITDKATFRHIRSSKLDAALAKIEATQRERLFDAAAIPIDSQEAYELAKAWPSRPPRMASWPVIYRLRCIHFKLPHFKVEVTVTNETEDFLGQLSQDIGLMLKSSAYTESIRRVKLGPFSIDDAITDRELDTQSVLTNLANSATKYNNLDQILQQHNQVLQVTTEHKHDARSQKPPC